jgi:phospholipase/carboxylesterase
MQSLETLEICTSKNPSGSVIWLHGLGADGHDFEPVVYELGLPQYRFILPHAPYRPVTINNSYSMRAWYDLYGLEAGSPQDADSIRATQRQIEALIEGETARGMIADRIVLAGFSQGGAIALHTALRHPQRLAGVMGLSTYLPLKDSLATEASAANGELPVFLAHGTYDNVISLALAEASAGFIRELGYPVTWHEYPMAHSVCMEEIKDIRDFLQAALN